jgi:hypothetical protein
MIRKQFPSLKSVEVILHIAYDDIDHNSAPVDQWVPWQAVHFLQLVHDTDLLTCINKVDMATLE